jgi:hypothetical protein
MALPTTADARQWLSSDHVGTPIDTEALTKFRLISVPISFYGRKL